MWRWALAPLPGFRTQLLWRLFGVFVYQIGLLLIGEAEGFAQLGKLPPALFPTLVLGLLLLGLGPRVLLLAALAASALALLVPIVRQDPPLQLAEEYLPLVVLPSLALLLVPLARRGASDPDAAVDAAQVALLRVALVVVMFFAAFHKLNRDFLDPAVSCAVVLAEPYLAWLPPAARLEALLPALALLGEASVPLLCLAAPRLGMPLTVAVMAVIGHRGATPFTMLVMVLSCAFLGREDGAVLARGMRRSWLEYHVLEVMALTLLFGHGLLLADAVGRARAAGRGGRAAAALRALLRRDLHEALPPGRAVRALLLGLAAAGLLNGVTPYLGLKFRMSFAMFSNLRADDARWNHWLVPRGVQLRAFDPFVHVTDVRYADVGRIPGFERSAGVQLGLYTPRELRARLEYLRGRGVRLDLELAIAGRAQRFANASTSSELNQLLVRLPPRTTFQDFLPAQGPQPCIH
jgi:hypothetical protein